MSGLRNMLVLVVMAALLVGGVATPAAARAYEDTPAAWKWVPDGAVDQVLVRGERVYIAGEFTHLRNVNTGEVVRRAHLAKLSTSGELFRNWNPRANAAARALAINSRGTQLYVGGDFTRIDSTGRPRVAAVTTTGGRLVRRWKARVNDTVHDLAVRGSRLFIAGEFGRVDGVVRRRVAALARDDADLIRSFRAHANGRVRTLAVRYKTLYLGGHFTNVRGATRRYLASVSTGRGAPRSWRPTVCTQNQTQCPVFDIDVYQRGLYAGVGGDGGGRLRGFDAVSGAALWPAISTDGDVQAVAVSGSRVYAGGHFETTFGGQPRTMLAAVSRSSGAVIAGFAPMLTADRPGVNAVAAGTSRLFAVGGFNKGTTPENVAAYRSS